MNRSLKLSVLLALALGSAQAAAVQLGQVQVKSALGQPLLADIPLTPSSPGELSTLSAQLAPLADFTRAGITDGRPAMELQFQLASEDGHKVLRVTSAQPVNEPYLDLLVEVTTRAGKSVREVTILLDPPGSFAAAAPANQEPPAVASQPAQPVPAPAAAPAATAPAPAATAPAPAVASSAVPVSSPAPVVPAAPASSASAVSYAVKPGDTLSGVVRRVRAAGVGADQMLVALQQANPDAFYRDNINALKSGVVLRVPTPQEAQAMSTAAAIAEVRRQNGTWRNRVAALPTMVATAAARPETSSLPADETRADDRLALVPSKDGGSGAGARAGNDSAARKLHQDLLRSQESLTALQQQSSELKSRLQDLEHINRTNQRLLSLKDNEIAELQRKLAAARKAAHLPPAPGAAAMPATAASVPNAATTATPGQSTVVASASVASTPVSAASVAGVPEAAVVTAKSGAPKPAEPKPAVRRAAAAEALPWYMQPWVWETAAGALVLLLLLALLARRRKPKPAAVASSSLADRFHTAPATATTAGPVSTDPDQDELLDQLAEHPDDVGLHLELVALYYSRRDVEHFEAAAEAMYAHIADPQQDEWQDVVAMGEDLVPGHPLFQPEVPPAAGGSFDAMDANHRFHEEPEGQAASSNFDAFAAGGARDDFNAEPLDTDQSATGAPLAGDRDRARSDAIANGAGAPAMPPRPDQKKVSEYHFDFNLTSQRPSERSPEAANVDELAETPWSVPDEPAMPEPAEPIESIDWNFDAPASGSAGAGETYLGGEFSDDPIDTKLDLARAYLDMGDAEGARAMLEEVMTEGSQIQKDVASGLLKDLH